LTRRRGLDLNPGGAMRWWLRTWTGDEVLVVRPGGAVPGGRRADPSRLRAAVRDWLLGDDRLARQQALEMYGALPFARVHAWDAFDADMAARAVAALEEAFARGWLVALEVPRAAAPPASSPRPDRSATETDASEARPERFDEQVEFRCGPESRAIEGLLRYRVESAHDPRIGHEGTAPARGLAPRLETGGAHPLRHLLRYVRFKERPDG
jgi:hypothetical protein